MFVDILPNLIDSEQRLFAKDACFTTIGVGSYTCMTESHLSCTFFLAVVLYSWACTKQCYINHCIRTLLADWRTIVFRSSFSCISRKIFHISRCKEAGCVLQTLYSIWESYLPVKQKDQGNHLSLGKLSPCNNFKTPAEEKPSQLIAASPRSVQRTPRRSPGLMEKAKPKVDSEKEGIKLHFGSGSESMAEPKEVIPLPRESAKSHNGGSNIRIH